LNFNLKIYFNKKYIVGMGVWGWGIGDWGLGIGPNPHSPIPNPQSPIPNPHGIYSQNNNSFHNIKKIIYKFKLIFI